ncbi:hypothetical protein PI125_g3056 [Phytophthora idaei]|nr:hypothetical protein PI125_g3056 [Phytophthora idaei]
MSDMIGAQVKKALQRVSDRHESPASGMCIKFPVTST